MPKILPQIALIGAGQLGSRHLQGLKRINRDVAVTVVEPNPQSTEIARERFDQDIPDTRVQSVEFLTDIKQLTGKFEIAIIATNADVRRQIVEQLFEKTDVQYLVLEKVAFQSAEDFRAVTQLTQAKKVATWVNCTRRMYPFYQDLKKLLAGEDRLSFHVEGRNWGLAGNSIHFIDLFAFLTANTTLELRSQDLDDKLYDSKRKNYKEFGGRLSGHSKRGDAINLVDYKGGDKVALSIHIICGNWHIQVNEPARTALLMGRESNWVPSARDLQIPFQSELSHLFVQQILEGGTCDLTPLEEAYQLHQPMLTALLDHLAHITGHKYRRCPIT